MGLTILKDITNPLKKFCKYKIPCKYKVAFKNTLRDRIKRRHVYNLNYSFYAKRFLKGFYRSFTYNKPISSTVSSMNSGKRDGELMEEAGKMRLIEPDNFLKFKDLLKDITNKDITHIREPLDPHIPFVDALLIGNSPKDNLALEIKTCKNYEGGEFAECLVNANSDSEKIIKNSGKNIIIILGQNGCQKDSIKAFNEKKEEEEKFCFNGHCLIVDGRFERITDTKKISPDGRTVYKMYGFPFEMEPYTFKM